MDLSVNWLNTILNFQIPVYKTKQLDKLLTFYGFNPDSLTLNGFEVESIYNQSIMGQNDIIVEIDTTPNRRDLHSIAGLSDELSILLNITPNQKKFYSTKSDTVSKISKNIIIENTESPLLYLQAHNITFKQSPKWLKRRLKTYNITSTNLFSDLTHYIQLEWGQTIQFYDLDKITDFNLKLEQNNLTKNFFITSDNKQTLSDCQVLSNKNQILSLCGIAINDELKIDENTKAILIECSYYSREEVKLNCNKTKIRTTISTFNEKGGTSQNLLVALQRILKLITLNYPSIRFKTGPFLIPNPNAQKYLNLNYDQIRQILGQSKKNHELTEKEIEFCAKRLKFPIIETSNKQLKLEIPQSRFFDIEEEIDLIEEIGRMYGFNAFKSQIPKLKKIGKLTPEQKITDKFKTFTINNGFFELINYSFTTIEKNEVINNKTYNLLNPISAGNALQQNLISNLIETIEFNAKQQNQLKRGFEVARVFSKYTQQEITFFSGFITNEKYQNNWGNEQQSYSWYTFKAFLTNLLIYLGIKNTSWVQSEINSTNQLHPGRTAILKQGSHTLGLVGQIHPVYAKQKNISLETYIFELNGTLISQISNTNPHLYQNFGLFPSITRDISFTIKRIETTSQYEALLRNFINESENFVKNIFLKDNYEFAKNNKSYRTLTYSFIFQSDYRTLKNEEVEEWMNKLETHINQINAFQS